MSRGTAEAILCGDELPRFEIAQEQKPREFGLFVVLPFGVQHDAREPMGFLIRHRATGETALYATDTYYLRFTFTCVHYWIVECNFTERLLQAQLERGELSARLYNRLTRSHMSLRRLVDALHANDLTDTRAIVLVHLSDERSDEREMVDTIRNETGIDSIFAANAGDVIPLELHPF